MTVSKSADNDDDSISAVGSMCFSNKNKTSQMWHHFEELLATTSSYIAVAIAETVKASQGAQDADFYKMLL